MKKFAVILVFSLVATPVLARGFTPAQREACTADYQKFCASVPPGGGRIVKCLKDHAGQLGEKCRAAMDMAARRAPRREACMADHQRFCASVMPGGGAIVKCLLEHKDQLSAECRGAISEAGTSGQ